MSDTDRPTGRHPLNIGQFVMGLAFVGLVGVWALIQGGVVSDHDIRWLLPVPWVLAGVAGLLATTLTSRDRWGTRSTGWVGQAGTTEATTRPATWDDTTEVTPDDTPDDTTGDTTKEIR